jgi:hypothetical protein
VSLTEALELTLPVWIGQKTSNSFEEIVQLALRKRLTLTKHRLERECSANVGSSWLFFMGALMTLVSLLGALRVRSRSVGA